MKTRLDPAQMKFAGQDCFAVGSVNFIAVMDKPFTLGYM